MKTMPLSKVKTKLSELVDAVERRDELVSILLATANLLQ